MSTRSSITVKVEDKFKSIYCHWDGYPSHNGKILLKHYNGQELAESVVSLGHLSLLGKSMEKPDGHDFDHRVEGYSIAYGRDRGEEDVDTKICSGLDDVDEQDYNYYWDGEKWMVNGKKLTKKMCKKD